ncbi:MAG TPA: CpsB/CapC family capsule biosynthesis tyrosine phosphatase [Gaiellaceae bacterium]
MIDTHCHLLPALDDGPQRMESAIELAEQLVAADISFVLCTPHFSRLFPTSADLARERLLELRGELFTHGIRLKLSLAAEVSPGLLVSATSEELLARRVGAFLLVELEPDTPVGFLSVAVDALAELDLRPIFAHPERSRAIRMSPRLLEEARARGALVQVVAPSLTGRWGGEAATAAWRFLEVGCVDLLASDAHRARREGTHIARARRLVEERFGRARLVDLTERGPAAVVGRSPQPA